MMTGRMKSAFIKCFTDDHVSVRLTASRVCQYSQTPQYSGSWDWRKSSGIPKTVLVGEAVLGGAVLGETTVYSISQVLEIQDFSCPFLPAGGHPSAGVTSS